MGKNLPQCYINKTHWQRSGWEEEADDGEYENHAGNNDDVSFHEVIH